MGYGRTGDGKTGPDGTRRDQTGPDGTRRNQTEDGKTGDGRRDPGDVKRTYLPKRLNRTEDGDGTRRRETDT
eukprot:1993415-Prymnesium_polylepis.1